MAGETKTPGPMGGSRGIKKDKIKDRKEKLSKEQRLMRKENFHTGVEKSFREDKETYKKVDPGFKKGENKEDVLVNIVFKKDPKKYKRVFDENKASNREAGRTSRAKGGRIGLKHGGGAALRGISPILKK